MYSPTYTEGIGLSDGEGMERIWSYLRRFARITKEIRPAHCIDILTHSLLYYGLVSKKKFRKSGLFVAAVLLLLLLLVL